MGLGLYFLGPYSMDMDIDYGGFLLWSLIVVVRIFSGGSWWWQLFFLFFFGNYGGDH